MNNWIISYKDFDPSLQKLRETIFTLGNGYFATRGAHEDGISSIHYPGTYSAGVYNRLSSTINDKKLINEDLVNLPNWLPISFKIEEEWFDITKVKIISYCSLLHLKKGVIKRTLKFMDPKGRIFILSSLRFVSQHNPHFGGLTYSIISTNWEGKITLRSSIMGNVLNKGVPRYKDLSNCHIEILKKGAVNDCLYMQVRTKSSHIVIAEAVKTQVSSKKNLKFTQSIIDEDENIHQEFYLTIRKCEKIRINKIISLFTSKDTAVFENLYDAKEAIKNQNNLHELLKKHMSAWKYLWHLSDMEIDTVGEAQKLIRLHLFHSLQTLSKHSINIDYGIPARGLHGEAYRGHVFWDEIFILPFFIFHFPDIARAMLMYRYHRLDTARNLAKENGYRGAMFPWQSGSNGEEETQKYHLNPQSSKWGPDNSRYQRHVNLAIAYNVWNYYETTNDFHFLKEYGAEILLEIAKFISSLASFNDHKKRYEIKNVMGPDEYHESYPGSSQPGINNNAYTNILAVWVLEKALQLTVILDSTKLQYFFETLDIDIDEINRWKDITHQMFVPFYNGILSQFENFEELKEFDWEFYKEKYGHIERLDRILKAENKNPNEFKIAKQPDVLMLFYLLESSEIERLLTQLNYSYNSTIQENTIAYYLARTSHGSTLSKITFSDILSQIAPDTSKQLFQEALVSDIQDTQGGTTEEGIHLGVMVGTTSVLFKTFAGIKVQNKQLYLNPHLPSWICRLNFKFIFNQNLYQIEIFKDVFHLKLLEKRQDNALIIFNNEPIDLGLHKTINLNCNRNQGIEKKLKDNIGALCEQVQERNLE
ncbi:MULTISPECIES: glycoside hydrolase family 65 protein [Legionella]|uniref:Trehalose 6-phosphate phosphorylase n=1 Tax=Legionella drozanskii LLAP-1 TaxID=1212489 RepID=A0A0W0SQ48_9GAMM|nr:MULTISPECIES: glycoside hydrolase family 65 protein [Legionella]KTC85530.1 Trehalose 6-phosphate phosphorylase [Legionella drozanskii LLAP-1]PJE15612.1 MAG: glycoside hydrolase family 65 protein [Legionella sp.]